MKTASQIRAEAMSISVGARPDAEINELALNVTTALIAHDPNLGDAIANALTDIYSDYPTAHLVNAARAVISTAYGDAPDETIHHLLCKCIELSMAMALEDPAIVDRMFGEA